MIKGHQLLGFEFDKENYERVEKFLSKNNSYIGEADVKYKNTNNNMHYPLYHYDSSTVILQLKENGFVMGVYSDTQEKANEVFKKLEDIVLGKFEKQVETVYGIFKEMAKEL